MKLYCKLLTLLGILLHSACFSQTIMVLPFTKEKEDLRTVLDADVNRRIAITKIQEAFDNRGFSTISFTNKLKEALTDAIFSSESQDDIKAQLVAFSGADIYVEAEIDISGNGAGTNSAKVILQAFDASTSVALSNKVCQSPLNRSTDYGALVTNALGKNQTLGSTQVPCMEEFLNTMQAKFDGFQKEGRPVKINFSLAASSKWKFSTELPQDKLPLSDVIEAWISENAFLNAYHIQGTTALKVFYDLVRVPVRDEKGKLYQINSFALKIYQFLAGKGIKCTKEVKSGTIYITLN